MHNNNVSSNESSTPSTTLSNSCDSQSRHSQSGFSATHLLEPNLSTNNDANSAAAAAAAQCNQVLMLGKSISPPLNTAVICDNDIVQHAAEKSQFDPEMTTATDIFVPFLSNFKSQSSQQHSNATFKVAPVPYTGFIDCQYGMELFPGNFVHLPIPIPMPMPFNKASRSAGSISPLAVDTNSNVCNGESMVGYGVVDSNAIVSVDAADPILDLNQWKSAPYSHNGSNFTKTPYTTPPTTYTDASKPTATNCTENRSSRVAQKPLPALELNLDNRVAVATGLPISENNKPLARAPSDNQPKRLPLATSHYGCVYCEFKCVTMNELNMHMIMHNANHGAGLLTFGNTSSVPPLAPSLSLQQPNISSDDLNVNSTCRLCGHMLRPATTNINGVGDSSLGNSNTESRDNNSSYYCASCGKEYQLPQEMNLDSNVALCRADRSSAAEPRKQGEHLRQQNNVPYVDSISYRQHDERYYCTRCNRNYKHNRDLRKHEKQIHGLDVPQLSKSARKRHNQPPHISPPEVPNRDRLDAAVQLDYNFPSVVDDVSPNTENELRLSLKACQLPQYVCEKCGKNFRGPFELRRHNTTVHENKKTFKCNFCGKSFRDTYEIKRHNVSQHKNFVVSFSLREHRPPVAKQNSMTTDMENVSKFALQYNNATDPMDLKYDVLRKAVEKKLSPNQSVLLDSANHMKRYHNNQIVGSCAEAQQRIMATNNYPLSIALSDQQLVDTTQFASLAGESINEYHCGICLRCFRGANEFRRHYSTVHEKKYRYRCVECGKLWRDQYDLKRHCKRGHFYGREIDRDFIRKCLIVNQRHSEDNYSSLVNPNSIETSTNTVSDKITQSTSKTDPNSFSATSHDHDGVDEPLLYRANDANQNYLLPIESNIFSSTADCFAVMDDACGHLTKVSTENSTNSFPCIPACSSTVTVDDKRPIDLNYFDDRVLTSTIHHSNSNEVAPNINPPSSFSDVNSCSLSSIIGSNPNDDHSIQEDSKTNR